MIYISKVFSSWFCILILCTCAINWFYMFEIIYITMLNSHSSPISLLRASEVTLLDLDDISCDM